MGIDLRKKLLDDKQVLYAAINATEYRLRQYRAALLQIAKITGLPYSKTDKQILDIVKQLISEEIK